jgi:hypothetical protein
LLQAVQEMGLGESQGDGGTRGHGDKEEKVCLRVGIPRAIRCDAGNRAVRSGTPGSFTLLLPSNDHSEAVPGVPAGSSQRSHDTNFW